MSKPTNTNPSTKRTHPRARSLLPLLLLTALCASSPALAYAGEKLLNFAAQYVIAPLGILSVVTILAGSIFNNQLARGAVYALVTCILLFLVIKMAPQLMTALST